MKYSWLIAKLPNDCVACHLPGDSNLSLCLDCQAHLPRIENPCRRCGIDTFLSATTLCSSCLTAPPNFDKVIAGYRYEGLMTHLITQLKFFDQLNYANLLGQLMLDLIRADYQNEAFPECIIPIPLHRDRLKQRGFNQALEIAKPIKKALRIPLLRRHAKRLKATRAQTHVSSNERQQNLQQAFSIPKLPHKHVAVIDDVMTSGHTMQSFCDELRQAGAQKIDVWCLARPVFS